MSPSQEDFMSWISSIEPIDEADAHKADLGSTQRKRRLLSPSTTSPLARSEANATPTNKRCRFVNNEEEGERDYSEETPRAFSARGRSSQTPSSNVEGAASPTKQLLAMKLYDDGFIICPLLTWPMSGALGQLVKDIKTYTFNAGVIPASHKPDVEASGDIDEFVLPFVFSESPQLPCLALAEVRRLVERASLCELRREEEASWNASVHHPMLLAACQPEGKRGLVDFMTCTTAQISPSYLPRNAPGKMVDFCMHIDPAFEPDDQAVTCITQHRRLRADISINHTNYEPLLDLPIAVSIETKKGGDNWDKAVLQMGTWQVAHLRRLADDGSSIEFLPGIIVMGHFWHLVITVKEAGAKLPTLLSSIIMGSSDTVLGVYKILAGVARLRRWSEEEYWPAFKRGVLGIKESDAC